MWLASRTFLDVRNTQRRLTATVAHEHEIVRAAHASFRQVTHAFVITMLPWHPLFYVFSQTSSRQPFRNSGQSREPVCTLSP